MSLCEAVQGCTYHIRFVSQMEDLILFFALFLSLSTFSQRPVCAQTGMSQEEEGIPSVSLVTVLTYKPNI